MPSSKPLVLVRTSADPIMEELVHTLAGGEPFEFKGLFAQVYGELKRKKTATGSEEVIRLRCYERLIKLSSAGLVEKKDKVFRALPGIEQATHGHAQMASFRRKAEMTRRAVDFG